MATASQAKCIYALSKQLGAEVDFVEALELPFDVASTRIDELKQRVAATDDDGEEAAGVTKQWDAVRNWDVRFGMVAKTVMQHYLRTEQPLPSPIEFTLRVRGWFELVNAADRALKPSAGAKA